MGHVVSSEMPLKRSDLQFYDDQLKFHVGDNLDVWYNASTNRRGFVVIESANNREKPYHYRGSVRIRAKKDSTIEFWNCVGYIDTENVPDGEYTVSVLLPQDDGTYARNVLPGTVTVALGTATVVSKATTVR